MTAYSNPVKVRCNQKSQMKSLREPDVLIWELSTNSSKAFFVCWHFFFIFLGGRREDIWKILRSGLGKLFWWETIHNNDLQTQIPVSFRGFSILWNFRCFSTVLPCSKDIDLPTFLANHYQHWWPALCCY